jgi:hypothetical protein
LWEFASVLRPPFTVNWEAAPYDQRCATFWFWSCAMTPGDRVASSVVTRDTEGISVICSCVMTVPDVAEVVSISGASAVTETVWSNVANLQYDVDQLGVCGL